MVNKSRIVPGTLTIPGGFGTMVNENQDKVSSVKYTGAMVTQNNSATIASNAPASNSITTIMMMMGVGS